MIEGVALRALRNLHVWAIQAMSHEMMQAMFSKSKAGVGKRVTVEKLGERTSVVVYSGTERSRVFEVVS